MSDTQANPWTASTGSDPTPSYARLPKEFYARVDPTSVEDPRLLRLNTELAEELGLSAQWLASPAGVSMLAGNRPLGGVGSIAMAYAGHQFGNWVPSLGDGRALLIGELVDRAGVRRDLQLKGSGPTPFSRRGDGRAALGPVVREYVVSEAMQALGIPTTRALAMVTTGERVLRDRPEPGAILTRVARGFVRVGTFQYFHGRGLTDHVRALADYVIERRHPELRAVADGPGRYRALLDEVIAGQAELIARWLAVGFIHGVMNTDNMSVLGETIDYGPCAFLDEYEPGKVFSSIDQHGRYAYDQQPGIGLWNLTRFAETLLPLLIETDAQGDPAAREDAAVEVAKDALAAYAPRFQRTYDTLLHRKLGLQDATDASREIVADWLALLAKQRADFTLAFRRLSGLSQHASAGEPDAARSEDEPVRSLFEDPAPFDAWARAWRTRLREEAREDAARNAEMRAVNPAFIPRNHRIQQAIDALVDARDEAPLEALLRVTARPFDDQPELADYAAPPEPHEVVHRTFCGT